MKSIISMARRAGHIPGILMEDGQQTKLLVLDYSADRHEEFFAESIEQLGEPSFPVRWIRCETGTDSIEQLGTVYGIHPLVLEDIQNHGQRPKFEDYGNYVYIVLKVVILSEDNAIHFEHLNLVLGHGWVLTFYNDPAFFKPLVQRIEHSKGRIAKNDADYLCYAIIDFVIDHYFLVLEQIGEQIEDDEEEIVADPTPQLLHKIKSMKTQMLFFRKAVWPVRDMLNSLERGEAKLFTEETLLYVRDAQDHIIQVIDTTETYRDIISGMLDIYLSSISYKLNEVMKLLTIISTIFIPITFITSLYGMNFKIMPELEWEYGYASVWGVILLISGVMLYFFRKRRWI